MDVGWMDGWMLYGWMDGYLKPVKSRAPCGANNNKSGYRCQPDQLSEKSNQIEKYRSSFLQTNSPFDMT